MPKHFILTLLAATMGCVSAAGVAQSPVRDYVPDSVFTGSQLTGWTVWGGASWHAQDGEIVANGGTTGGWLISPTPLQDMAVYAKFQCGATCKAGIMLRVQRTTDGGLKGYFIPLGAPRGEAAVSVTVDASGKEVSRTALASATSLARFSPPAGGRPIGPAATMGIGPAIPGIDAPKVAGQPLAPPVVAPIIPVPGAAAQPPLVARVAPGARGDETSDFKPGAWNEISTQADANIVRSILNWSPGRANTTDDEAQSYGPFALYVAPGTEIRFKDVAFKDLGRQTMPAEKVSNIFRMQRLDDFFYAWDAAVGDINQDGVNDIVAGPYYYLGPAYTTRREIYLANAFNPGTEFVRNGITFAADFTGDGWPDVLASEAQRIVLYVNPKGELRRWDRYVVVPGARSEIALLRDLDNDGQPELIYAQDGRLAFARPGPDPLKPWPVFLLSAPGDPITAHGLGVGDINGDGRPDILQSNGWWEQPAGGPTSSFWNYHPFAFAAPSRSEAPGGGNMAVFDVNGDGLNDVVTSLNAHGFGLVWFEQKRSAQGAITFLPHMIMGDYTSKNAGDLTFSQLHAGVVPIDVDHDGVMDFVTGKRFWSHLDSYTDPDPNGPAYLVLYRGRRSKTAPGGVSFLPEIIHNRSGVGSMFKVVDVNKDGHPDIVTSGTRGTFVFWGKPPTNRKK